MTIFKIRIHVCMHLYAYIVQMCTYILKTALFFFFIFLSAQLFTAVAQLASVASIETPVLSYLFVLSGGEDGGDK